MQLIKINLTEFAFPSPKHGHINTFMGLANGQLMGVDLHLKAQTERLQECSNYKAEVKVQHDFIRDDYKISVAGRMDGIYDGEKPWIEEIKTSFNIFDLQQRIKEGDHPYTLQLKTYGYLYWLKHKIIPELSFHLISNRDRKTKYMPVKLVIDDYELWLNRRLAEIIIEAKFQTEKSLRRKKLGEQVQFPFSERRKGQLELIDTIEDNFTPKQILLIQAPTGIGKTIGALYPSVKNALQRGQQVVYLTAKNSQHDTVAQTIQRFHTDNSPVKYLVLNSKKKMCFQNEPVCDPKFCEYAKDYYTKLDEFKIRSKLQNEAALSPKIIKTYAKNYEVCPYELQLEIINDVDIVIGDYNYIFSPSSRIEKLREDPWSAEKINLVVDEVHNLHARAMNYYSATLSITSLIHFKSQVLKQKFKTYKKLLKLIDTAIEFLDKCEPSKSKISVKIKPPVTFFKQLDVKFREYLSDYLNNDITIEANDPVMALTYHWGEFTTALENTLGGKEAFIITFHPNPSTIKITCCDASEQLEQDFKYFNQVIGISATLKPFEYYKRLLGLSKANVATFEFDSSFPTANRKIIVIPQISSKYTDRARNYPRIAEVIERVIQIKNGNYFAFFPSFEFLDKVAECLKSIGNFEMLIQKRNSGLDEVDHVLQKLSSPSSACLVLAVQGGVFSEGIDYPGKMAIGAFVIGPALPSFDLERNNIKNYYQKQFGEGFDYAFTFPAMAKTIQSAGRVIRSETDKGIIVLMDSRFLQASYAKCFPNDWFTRDAYEMVSKSILADISDFWKSVE